MIFQRKSSNHVRDRQLALMPLVLAPTHRPWMEIALTMAVIFVVTVWAVSW